MRNKEFNLIIIISIIVDRIIKMIIQKTLNYNEVIVVIKNFFSITYVKNKGAAFSIMSNHQELIKIISVVVLLILMIYLYNERRNSNKITFLYAIIIGGICGNLIDRIIYNSVIDYLSFKFFNYYFPIFNLADCLIVAGVILLVIEVVRSDIIARSSSR